MRGFAFDKYHLITLHALTAVKQGRCSRNVQSCCTAVKYCMITAVVATSSLLASTFTAAALRERGRFATGCPRPPSRAFPRAAGKRLSGVCQALISSEVADGRRVQAGRSRIPVWRRSRRRAFRGSGRVDEDSLSRRYGPPRLVASTFQHAR